MKKRYLVASSMLLFVASAVAAWYLPEKFWQPLVLSIASSFFAIGMAIVAVNIYLERESRKGAIQAILLLAHEAIRDFHNSYMDLVYTRFSKEQFKGILKRFTDSRGDANELTADERSGVAELAKKNAAEFEDLITALDASLGELTQLVGWNLDSSLLAQAIHARKSIRSFRAAMRGTSDAEICRNWLDIDIHSKTVHNILSEMAGIE